MNNLKEKLKAAFKEESYSSLLSITISIILGILIILVIDNIKWKLFLGGLFFLVHSTILWKENKFSAFFEFLVGIMALVTFAISNLSINHYFLLYGLILLMFLGFLYTHRSVRNKKIEDTLKRIYHISYIILFSIVSIIIVIMIKDLINYKFQESLLPIEYMFIIELAIISIITFFLLADNFILIIPKNIRENLIGKNYSASYAIFISLCITILIGGFFYINLEQKQVLKEIFVVLATAFFTSLVIANSIKSLFSRS